MSFLKQQISFLKIFASFFSVMIHNSSIRFSWNFIYFQQNFTWAVESLKFCTLMGSFCPNHIKFQLKNYLSWHWRVMQNLKKKLICGFINDNNLVNLDLSTQNSQNCLMVSNMKWGIWWVFIQPLKRLKIYFQWALFVRTIPGLSNKNTEELSFMTLNSDAKFE